MLHAERRRLPLRPQRPLPRRERHHLRAGADLRPRPLRPIGKLLAEDTKRHHRALILQRLFADGPASRADLARATDDTWVVVEKVLDASDPGEPLPPDWQTAGTTGYETLTVINGLIVDPMGEGPLSRLYTDLTGETADFAAVADVHARLRSRRFRRLQAE